MMKKILLISVAGLMCLAFMANRSAPDGVAPVLDSSMARYYVHIVDTLVYDNLPPATRLYVYTANDMLYNSCTVTWQLAYGGESGVSIIKTGTVPMFGDAYAAYAADNRNVSDLFTYAATRINVTIVP